MNVEKNAMLKERKRDSKKVTESDRHEEFTRADVTLKGGTGEYMRMNIMRAAFSAELVGRQLR